MPGPTNRILQLACHLTYKFGRVDKESGIAKDAAHLEKLAQLGYHCLDEFSCGVDDTETNLSQLGYCVLEPTDPEAPMILAFRGTKVKDDVIDDIRLVLRDSCSAKLYEDANRIYRKLKHFTPRFRDRPFIITGHSLGGHIAQRVFVSSCVHGREFCPLRTGDLVRTFNTAPYTFRHSTEEEQLYAAIEKHPDILHSIINYRINVSVFSSAPLNQ